MELLLQFVFVAAFLTPALSFCGDRKLNGDLSRASVKAGEWLREQMGENGTLRLGHATANAFHSLRLVGYSVPKVSKLGTQFLKQEVAKTRISSISGGRLALYILGVISSCEDPRDFDKQNLVDALKMSSYGTVGGFNHPFQLGLALLALCTSGERVNKDEVRFLVQKLRLDDDSLHGISTLSMGTMALSCIKHKQRRNKKFIKKLLKKSIRKATKKLISIQRKKKDGFGNEASTSLAVQALLAARVKGKHWNCEGTMKRLLAMQDETGAFANVLGTIRTLPALIGSVYYDVKDLMCPKPDIKEERKNITVCMRLEFEANLTSKVPPPAEYFIVKNGTNAHSIMKLASTRHPCYNFTTVLTSWGSSVESICGVSKNHTLKRYWSILIDPGRRSAPYGIDTFKPRDGECLIFRYKQYNWK